MPSRKRLSQIPGGGDVPQLRTALLNWYDANKRDLPWRATRDPYAIWVSEIMLQQTRVAAVIDRYNAFLERFPSVVALAVAPEQEVLALWSGLGYYRRARMMHKAAQLLAADHGGALPAASADLRKLPGIGAYTAAAIASIAHGEPVAVVDGNVERVICRLSGWEAAGGAGATAQRREIDAFANQLLDAERPGDFNQAMMELGATVCVPRSPQCDACPLVAACKTRGEHKTTPRPKMQSRKIGYALVLRKGRGSRAVQEVLLEQRSAAQSVMPGLWELPMLRTPEVPDDGLLLAVRHSIMQVNYEVRVHSASVQTVRALTVEGGERSWFPIAQAAALPLTGLARKILKRLRLVP
jgi:A/G-specific adenine glycosylase